MSGSEGTTDDHDNLPAIDRMTGREMKLELESYGISTKSFFEKNEYRTALEKAWTEGLQPKSTASTSSTTSRTTETATSSASTGIDISKLTQAVEELAQKAQVEVTSDAVQQNHKLSSFEKNMTDKLTEMSTEIKTMSSEIKTMVKLQTKHQRLDWAFANSEGHPFECAFIGNYFGHTQFICYIREILTAFRRNRGYCITDYTIRSDDGEGFRAKITDHLDGLLGTTTRLEHADGEWMIYL